MERFRLQYQVFWYVVKHGSSAILFTVLELGPLKKKMVHTFGDSFAAARTEGVFLGLESGHKYRVKSTDLFEELSWKYGANQMLLHESFKERPQKGPNFHGPQRLSLSADISSPAVPNMADRTESCPSFCKNSESKDDNPQIPGIFSVQVDTNPFKHVPALYK